MIAERRSNQAGTLGGHSSAGRPHLEKSSRRLINNTYGWSLNFWLIHTGGRYCVQYFLHYRRHSSSTLHSWILRPSLANSDSESCGTVCTESVGRPMPRLLCAVTRWLKGESADPPLSGKTLRLVISGCGPLHLTNGWNFWRTVCISFDTRLSEVGCRVIRTSFVTSFVGTNRLSCRAVP